MLPDAKLLHDLLRTPADAGTIPTIGTAVTFRLHLGSFPDQVVAVIPTKAAPGLCAVPEMAQTAIGGLLWGIHFLLHIQTSNLHYFSGKSRK